MDIFPSYAHYTIPFISAKPFAAWREPTQNVGRECFIQVFSQLGSPLLTKESWYKLKQRE